eukprot:7080789-Karenia_brevis.AAC.1
MLGQGKKICLLNSSPSMAMMLMITDHIHITAYLCEMRHAFLGRKPRAKCLGQKPRLHDLGQQPLSLIHI